MSRNSRAYTHQISNLTPISRTHGKAGMTCPICGIRFERYISHLARVGCPTCSYACAGMARRVRIITNCRVCGTAMEHTPSDAARITTCSKRCSSLRRTGGNPLVSPSGTAAYKNAAAKALEAGQCKICGVKHGPWSVVGIKVEYSDGIASLLANGELWCRQCHLAKASALGAHARRSQAAGKVMSCPA